MTDERPRPEYGEYATPEEQAAAIGTVPEAMQDITPQAVVEPPVPPISSGRRWDVIISVALLVFGVYSTISGLSQYSAMQATIEQLYAVYGYTGTYTDPSLASGVGLALNIVQPVALVVAVYFTYRRLRAGRIAFWIPLTVGVVVTAISGTLITVMLFADPGFIAFASKTMGL